MMEPIGHHDPTHLAECIERRADIVGGCAGAMNPEGITRESNDGSSRSLANTTEPYRLFGDPDGVWHDDIEGAGNCSHVLGYHRRKSAASRLARPGATSLHTPVIVDQPLLTSTGVDTTW